MATQDKPEPAIMSPNYLQDAALTLDSQLAGWVTRNTVVVFEGNKTYLVCGRRVKPEKMKLYPLYIEWREGGYHLWIPSDFKGRKWAISQKVSNITYLPVVDIHEEAPQ